MTRETEKVLITIRRDYLHALDAIVNQGGATSRSDLFEKIVGGFLSDFHKKQLDGALGGLAAFFLGVLGVAGVAAILDDIFSD